MEWSKIKNIVILLLALVNVFLLVLVVSQERRSVRYQEEARTEAVAVLAKNGFSAGADPRRSGAASPGGGAGPHGRA